MPISTLLFPAILALGLTACFDTGKDDDDDDDGGGDGGTEDGGTTDGGTTDGGTTDGGTTDGGTTDGGTTDGGTTDGGTTDGGTTDGGTTDGGSSDGGSSDGGSSDGGTGDGGGGDGGTGDGGTGIEDDTGIALIYWIGEATVVTGSTGSYEGWEGLYTTTFDGSETCTLSYDVEGTPNSTCDSCEWAFDIAGMGGGASDGGGTCDLALEAFGLADVSTLGDDWEFSYGWADDGYLWYDYGDDKSGPAWYATYYSTASVKGDQFTYEWYAGGFYFYWTSAGPSLFP